MDISLALDSIPPSLEIFLFIFTPSNASALDRGGGHLIERCVDFDGKPYLRKDHGKESN